MSASGLLSIRVRSRVEVRRSGHLRHDFIGPDARGVVVDGGDDHQLVCLRVATKRSGPHAPSRASRRRSTPACATPEPFRRAPVRSMSSIGGGWPGPAASEVGERLLRRREEPARLLVGLGGDDIHADHGVGPVELRRRAGTARGRSPAHPSARRARNATRTRRAGRGARRAARRRGSSRGSTAER